MAQQARPKVMGQREPWRAQLAIWSIVVLFLGFMYQHCRAEKYGLRGWDVVADECWRRVRHTEHIAWPLPSSPGSVVGPLAVVCQRPEGGLQRGSRV